MGQDHGSAGAQLRELIREPGISVMPGAYDALSAILAERAGFDAVFTTGFGLSASVLGKPDLGLMTMSENMDRVRAIAQGVSIPLVADMDTGYGNAINVHRTTHEVMDAGVAGVILEDQEWPKRCGHMREKRVVPTEEHVQRIRAAAEVRDERDGDLVIIGRTDARERHGLAEAIDRGHAFEAAGADVVFVEAPQSYDELERVAEAFDAPTLANMVEGGQTPYFPYSELDTIGFDMVVYPVSGIFAATLAVLETFETLRETGTAESVDTVSFHEFETIVDAAAYRTLEQRYAEPVPE